MEQEHEISYSLILSLHQQIMLLQQQNQELRAALDELEEKPGPGPEQKGKAK